MNRFKAFIIKSVSNIRKKAKEVFADSKKSSIFLACALALFFAIPLIISFAMGGYFNFGTDDRIQYYTFMNGFINGMKNGTLSIFDTSIGAGTSFSATLYYVPLDLFTLLAFFLSFIMEAERAVNITNYLYVIIGTLILYKIIIGDGKKIKTALLVCIVYASGGLLQAYAVFPAYLGIMFYAPLGILFINKFLSDRKFFYLLPIYSLTVILFNFYLAYMLLAFIVIYALVIGNIKNKYSFFSKKFFLINKEFYSFFLMAFGLILLGVSMGAFVLMPSVYYMLTETSRVSSTTFSNLDIFQKSYWLFSVKHYINIWVNTFVTHEPHNFMLVPGGAYAQEHVTFYMTSSGLIFFLAFFFISGKENNRLKAWVIFINMLFMIPLAAMIFSATTTPYSRWFFIVYIFNILAMTEGVEHFDAMVPQKKIIRFSVAGILACGLLSLIYIISGNTTIKEIKFFGTTYTNVPVFMHYDVTDYYDKYFFYAILICGIVFLVLLLSTILFDFFKKVKFTRFIIPIVMMFECLTSFIIIYTNCAYSSGNYYQYKDTLEEIESNLLDNSDYSLSSGYRINVDNSATDYHTNASSFAPNVNATRYFQSFYNANLNTYYKYALDNYYSGDLWSRKYYWGYNLTAASIFNTKYVVVNSAEIVEMNSNYSLVYTDGDTIDFNANTTSPLCSIYLEKKDGLSFSSSSIQIDNIECFDVDASYYDIEGSTNTIYSSSLNNTINDPILNSEGTIYTDVSDHDGYYKISIYLKTGDKAINALKFSYDITYDTSLLHHQSNYDVFTPMNGDGSSLKVTSTGLNHIYASGGLNYYELSDLPPFTIYDKVTTSKLYNSRNRINIAGRTMVLNNFVYYDEFDTDLAAEYSELNITKSNSYDLRTYLNQSDFNYLTPSHTYVNKGTAANPSYYAVYDLSSYPSYFDETAKIMQVCPLNTQVIQRDNEDMYIVDTNNHIHGMTYSTAYLSEDWDPKSLYVYVGSTPLAFDTDIYIYNDTFYTNFIETQNQYQDKYFSIDGSKLSIRCTLPDASTDRILKTTYTYSVNWKSSDSNLKTINVDGGFLGVVIPAGMTYIDFSIDYLPDSLVTGAKISAAGFTTFALITASYFTIRYLRRRNKHEENIDSNSML